MIAIKNPSSTYSGNIPSPDGWEAFNRLVAKRAYQYTHTTPVVDPHGTELTGRHYFIHHYRHDSGHRVNLRHGSNDIWDTSCGTATRNAAWSGKGLPELRAHLASKARRYGLK